MAAKRKILPATFYRTARGAEPVRKWLKALSREDKRIVGTDIATVEFGWSVAMPTCRALTSRRGGLGGGGALAPKTVARGLCFSCPGAIVALHRVCTKAQP